MPKSPVERYEQLLQQDPSSTVFVELAKALLEKGDGARAIEVCQAGLQHHPNSIVARVLWGKALIGLGKPAEAMSQFDQAVGIEKDNPYAYNLIAEVLLQRGLYRSALPILRKASTLQPNNGRVKEWLEKTQAALSGGPAPVLEAIADPQSPLAAPPEAEDEADGAQKPEAPAAERSSGEKPAVARGSGEKAREVLPEGQRPTGERPVLRGSGEKPQLRRTGEHPAAGATNPPAERAQADGAPFGDDVGLPEISPASRRPVRDPAAPGGIPVLRPSGEKRAIPVLHAAGESVPPAAAAAPSVGVGDAVTPAAGTLAPELTPPGAAPEPSEPSEEAGLLGDLPPPAAEESAGSGGLFPDIPAAAGAQAPPPQRQTAEVPRPPPVRASGEKRALLEDIPELSHLSASVEVPKVELSTSTAKAIAEEYERELREKLKANAEKKSFFAQHGLKLGIAAVLIAVIGVGAFAFISERNRNLGRNLGDALAEARKGISLDTGPGYRAAIEALGIAAQMDDDSPEVWALTAYANAVLFADHGGGAGARAAAEAALAKKNVDARFPALGVASRYHLATAQTRDAMQKVVLASTEDSAELNELAGRILLSKKDSRGAVERFRRALELSSSNVRALVALGDYYREAGDHPTALKFYETAAVISPAHPERAIGAGETRLELDTALAQSLEEVERLPSPETLRPELLARRELVFGRLLAANGRAPEAVKRLGEGARAFKARGYDFQMALGQAAMASGDYARAEDAFSEALKLRAGNDEAQELLGRVLIARGRARDALRLRDDSRRVALVRGIAASQLGDWKRARAELSRTQVSGKYPTEAVIHLAQADAAEGDVEGAEGVLQKVLSATKKPRSDAHVALGQLFLKKGDTEKARKQFEAAEKDPLDYEGACALGRLHLAQGQVEKARVALERAVARNGSHGEARHELGRLHLRAGQLEDALAQAEAWTREDPSSADALKDLALAQHLTGKWRDADASSARLTKVAAKDPEAHRIRAMVLFGVGNAPLAFKSLEQANKLDPTDPETFCEIGHAFLRQGNALNAQAAFGAALKNRPDSDCGTVGQILAKLPSGARGALKQLSERATRAAAVWDRGLAQATLAHAHLATGSVPNARKSAEEAVKLAPFLGVAHHALGTALLKGRDEEGAVKAFRQAVELEPAHASLRIAYADALARAGDSATALKEYETFLRLGGEEADVKRAEKVVLDLKKRLAAR